MRARSRRSRVWLAVVATSVACSVSSLLAQDTQDNLKNKLIFVPIRASQVMSAADQQRIGVDRLTPEQRFALDAWLTRYSAELRANAFRQPAAGAGRNVAASSTEQSAPTESATAPEQSGHCGGWGWTPLSTIPPAGTPRLDTRRRLVRSPGRRNALGGVRARPDVHRRVAGGRLHHRVARLHSPGRLRPCARRHERQHAGARSIRRRGRIASAVATRPLLRPAPRPLEPGHELVPARRGHSGEARGDRFCPLRHESGRRVARTVPFPVGDPPLLLRPKPSHSGRVDSGRRDVRVAPRLDNERIVGALQWRIARGNELRKASTLFRH